MSKKILILILSLLGAYLLSAQNIQDSYLAEARGDFQNALTIMQDLARQDPDDVFYTMRQAWLSYLLGQYNQAVTLYNKSLQELDHLDAHLGIINCHLALGEWNQARARADQLLKTDVDNPILLSKAAYAAYMNKDYATAVGYFERIASLYPWDMDNRGYLVNNLYLSGNIPKAKTEYRILKKYAPQSQIVVDYQKVLDQ